MSPRNLNCRLFLSRFICGFYEFDCSLIERADFEWFAVILKIFPFVRLSHWMCWTRAKLINVGNALRTLGHTFKCDHLGHMIIALMTDSNWNYARAHTNCESISFNLQLYFLSLIFLFWSLFITRLLIWSDLFFVIVRILCYLMHHHEMHFAS